MVSERKTFFFFEINIVFCIFCVVTDIVCCSVPPNSASFTVWVRRRLKKVAEHCLKDTLLKIGLIEEKRTTWGNQEVPQIFLFNTFIRENAIYSVWLRNNLWHHTRHEHAKIFRWLTNAMFDEMGERILLKTAILIHSKFIGGIIRVI